MGYRYAVVGSGRQGVAAAYDMARFGDAEDILLLDIDPAAAASGADRINTLAGRKVARSAQADAGNTDALAGRLEGTTSVLSAVHYPFNVGISEAAIRVGANMCDLGGNTSVVRKQLELDREARAAGVSVVPDCGMGPGMNVSLGTYAMSLVDNPSDLLIWDGGLPQEPTSPWHYVSTFHIEGLTNEYSGDAFFLRDGKITKVPCFEGLEELSFPPPIGRLEAFVTSGGLSTAPWTFEGKLERLENKTLRYPGHWAQFRSFAQLGLMGTKPVKVGDVEVIPRDFLHTLLEPQIRQPDVRDVCVMRVKCRGKRDGRPATATLELIDRYDEETGFAAMERITGWHASIIAILAAQGKIREGAVPVELAVAGKIVYEEALRRGFNIRKRVTVTRRTKATW